MEDSRLVRRIVFALVLFVAIAGTIQINSSFTHRLESYVHYALTQNVDYQPLLEVVKQGWTTTTSRIDVDGWLAQWPWFSRTRAVGSGSTGP